jgi:endonuclease YncB( thermonuclease family)
MANPSGSRTNSTAWQRPWLAFSVGIFVITLGSGALTQAAENWQKIKDCMLISNSANDGDSFHVRHNGKEYIFRLYFVDAPEIDNEFPERVAEQAAYFGVSQARVPTIGRAVARFTKEKLGGRFTILTCWQDAQGRSKLPRYFAFVEKDGRDLAQELVKEGLARIYGAQTNQPSGRPAKEYRTELEQLEREAKRNHHGAWARVP